MVRKNSVTSPNLFLMSCNMRSRALMSAPFLFLVASGHCFRTAANRDSIFPPELDKGVTAMGVRVVRTPIRVPQANAICERFGGTLRRECLDFLIPLNQRHLKLTLKSWVTHFNHGRPHMSLGPGIPVPLPHSPPANGSRHSIPAGHVIRSTAVLGGLNVAPPEPRRVEPKHQVTLLPIHRRLSLRRGPANRGDVN